MNQDTLLVTVLYLSLVPQDYKSSGAGMLLFFEDTNVFRLIGYKIDHYKMVKENNRKEVEIQEIAKKTSELTTNIKTLEFFARETYRMKKSNEVIFLFVPKSEEVEE